MLGIDLAFGNFSVVSFEVNSRFDVSGDPFHLTQVYVAELLARGVRVCFSGSAKSLIGLLKKYLIGSHLCWHE